MKLYSLMISVFVMLFISLPVFCQPEHVTLDRTYDVLHYKLNIIVDESTKTCFGDLSMKFIPLRPLFDQLQLDAGEMDIKNIRLGMKQLQYEHRADSLLVLLGKPYGLDDTLTLTIAYSVTSPTRGLYFINPDSGYPKKKYQVWSQGAAEDNHYWFPCYDFPNDRATSEMIVTVNDRFTAISNGKLLEVKKNQSNHTTTYHWFEGKPHVSYLISLVVGEYMEIKDTFNGLPISNYVYKDQQADALRSFGKTPKMIEFFEKKIGYPYPWEKFGQVVVSDFMFGGMENVSLVTLSDYTIHDSRAHLDYTSDGLVSHELAHQWFGDLLTCKDWSHAWLNEGFATFFENQFREYDLGKDDAAKELMDAQSVLKNVDQDERRRPMVCNRYIAPMDLFDSRIYGKGAVVLNMLRFTLGDELFWKAISHYVEKNAFRCVETNDFKVAIEEATGYNLQWFFDQWVYKAGCPEFNIVSTWNQSTRTVQLSVNQVQKEDSLTGFFRTPVDIEVWVHGNPEIYKVMVSQKEEMFSFPAYQEPQLVIFDRGSKLLKKVNYRKPISEWLFQLTHASEGVDRIQAIDELQWYIDSLDVIRTLSRAALEDPFWGVRQEAVWALGDAKNTGIADTLILAYGDQKAGVRVASVGSLGNFDGKKVLNILRHAWQRDSSYSVAAMALRSIVQLDSSNAMNYLHEAMKLDSHGEIIRRTALQLLSRRRDEEALHAIVTSTRYGVDQNIRIQAIEILAAEWKERDDVFYLLLKMVNDSNIHVRRSVIHALGIIGDERAMTPLEQRMNNEGDSRTMKAVREAIEQIKRANKND